MRFSSVILVVLLALLVTSIFASNIILKMQYQKVDKSDYYWNYDKILGQPFKYVKIDGGNVSNIVFEQSNNCSVRVLDYWGGYEKDSIKAFINNDTLYLKFYNNPSDLYKKFWLQSNVIVRLSAPVLKSIDGNNTNFQFEKLTQKSISINLSGKSRIEVESNIHNLDTINVIQKDSSQVIFEMNPDIKVSPIMSALVVNATLKDVTLLDIGHVYVNNLNLKIADSSAVILSGNALKAFHQ